MFSQEQYFQRRVAAARSFFGVEDAGDFIFQAGVSGVFSLSF